MTVIQSDYLELELYGICVLVAAEGHVPGTGRTAHRFGCGRYIARAAGSDQHLRRSPFFTVHAETVLPGMGLFY